jgi:WD40 repeat protein
MSGAEPQDIQTEFGNRRDPVTTLSYTADGKLLMSAASTGEVLVGLWDPESRQRVKTLGPAGERNGALSADGRFAVSVGVENTKAGPLSRITVWDFEAGKELKAVRVETRAVSPPQLALSANGQYFAYAESDELGPTVPRVGGRLVVWTVADGKQVLQMKGDYRYLDFSPDSKTIAVTDLNRGVKVVSLDTQKVLQSFTLTIGNVNGVRFSPNGQSLAAACVDHDLRIWNLKTGKLTRTLSGHSLESLQVAYLADGKTLISAGADETVRLWNLDTGKEKKSIKGFAKGALSVAVHPKETHIAVGCGDGLVRICELK